MLNVAVGEAEEVGFKVSFGVRVERDGCVLVASALVWIAGAAERPGRHALRRMANRMIKLMARCISLQTAIVMDVIPGA
jgi:hypothetical protein